MGTYNNIKNIKKNRFYFMERVHHITFSHEKQLPISLLQFSMKSKAIKKIGHKNSIAQSKK